MILDVTTTGMPRPKIHDRCFSSYTKNIKGVDWSRSTIYFNIDPFPCASESEREAMQNKRLESSFVAEKYFGNVVMNYPNVANYTTAYNWVWSQATSTLILNLEDDWKLNRSVHIEELIEPFQKMGTLYEVVLRAYTYRYPCTCTSPAILHKRYYGAIGGKLDTLRNPETQTHSRRDFGIFIPNKKNCAGSKIEQYVQVWPEPCNNINTVVSEDIGREWLDRSPYMRPQMLAPTDPRYKKKDKFRTWITKPGWSRKQIVNFIREC